MGGYRRRKKAQARILFGDGSRVGSEGEKREVGVGGGWEVGAVLCRAGGRERESRVGEVAG